MEDSIRGRQWRRREKGKVKGGQGGRQPCRPASEGSGPAGMLCCVWVRRPLFAEESASAAAASFEAKSAGGHASNGPPPTPVSRCPRGSIRISRAQTCVTTNFSQFLIFDMQIYWKKHQYIRSIINYLFREKH